MLLGTFSRLCSDNVNITTTLCQVELNLFKNKHIIVYVGFEVLIVVVINFASSAIERCVVHMLPDILEERIISIFRVE
jgi:hypothetical protein